MILSGLLLGDSLLAALFGVRGLLGAAGCDGEGVHAASAGQASLEPGTSWMEVGGVTKTTVSFLGDSEFFRGDFLGGFKGDFPFLLAGLFRGLGFCCRPSLGMALEGIGMKSQQP